MKKKMSILLICVVIIIMSKSCENPLTRFPVYIFNNSDLHLYHYLALGGEGGIMYPDTTLSFDRDVLMLKRVIEPWESYGDSFACEKGEEFSFLPRDTLSIYFFAKDTVDKYNWDDIKTKYKIVQRYDMSVDDFKQLHYRISYPPTVAMKNIKMHPPYGR